MRKLAEVDEAKALMLEAVEWSTFTWLWEKRRVREVADRANDALDRLNRSIKAGWDPALKAAYKNLNGKSHVASTPPSTSNGKVPPEILTALGRVKAADEAARRARDAAEETFDRAERELSTELAREGCRQAIESWELHEKAIRRAEAAPSLMKQG